MILKLLYSILSIGSVCGISVSGVSSGGFMAVQTHVAYSSEVSEVGVVAGGPYLCGNIISCTSYPNDIDVGLLVSSTRFLSSEFLIDNPSHMRGSVGYLYSGSLDTVVSPGVVKKLSEYYKNFGVILRERYNISSEHGWPTNSYGVECDKLKPPFIVRCGFSFSEFMFSHKKTISHGKIIRVTQVGGSLISMGEFAYVYIPDGIVADVHVSFHGCEQTIPDIGFDYVINSGLNKYNMIVVYPQAIRTQLNPYGCWDWWGYTGLQFATKLSPQMSVVMDIARFFVKVSNITQN